MNLPCGPGFIQSAVVRLEWEKGRMIAQTASEGKLVFKGDRVILIPPARPQAAAPKVKRKKKRRRPYGGLQAQKPGIQKIKGRPEPRALEVRSQKIDYEKEGWKKALGEGLPALYPRNYRRFQAKRLEGQDEGPVGRILAIEPAGSGTGAFWLVTREGRLKRFDPAEGRVVESGLTVDDRIEVTGLARASSGELWILAKDRLLRVNDRKRRMLTMEVIPYEGVGSVRRVIEEGKTLWFLAENGVLRYEDQILRAFTYRDGLPPGPILAVQRDREKNLWAGGPGGFGRLRLEGKKRDLLELQREVQEAEAMAGRKGVREVKGRLEEVARELGAMGMGNAQALQLLARVRYLTACKGCPPLGWRLVSPYLVESHPLSGKALCDILSRPVKALPKQTPTQDAPIEKPSAKAMSWAEYQKRIKQAAGVQQEGPFSGVVQALAGAVEREPGRRSLWLEYGNALLMNRQEEGVRWALEILKQRPFERDPDFSHNRGVAHAMLGDYGAARRIFERILAGDSKHLPALFNLMRILKEAGTENEQLERVATRYVKADPSTGPWHRAAQQILDSLQRGPLGLGRWQTAALILALLLAGAAAYLSYRQRLARARARRKARRDLPFSPIRNPYIVGNPIRSTKMFYGREDDFRFVRRKLKGEDQSLVIVFCGDRRSGKTSILFQILNHRLGEGFIPVLLDMQSIPLVNDEGEFLKKMAEETLSAVGHSEWLEEFSWDKGVNPFQTFESLLRRISESRPNDVLLYLFDEYELIEEKIREGGISADLIFFFANLLEGRGVSFIFTGSKRIEDRSEPFWRTLIGKSVYRKISFLSQRDTERLIIEPVQDTLMYDDAVVDRIVSYTAGSPFYTQVICQNLVDLANMKRTNFLTESELEETVQELLDNPLPQMIYFWDNLTQGEKVALSLMGTALEEGNRTLRPNALLRLVRKEKIPLSVDPHDLKSNLDSLFHKDILLKDDLGRYRFRVDLFRRWVGRDHSIWEVVHQAGSDVSR
jgi:AAA+ ATPase superfamily predicted ATPase